MTRRYLPLGLVLISTLVVGSWWSDPRCSKFKVYQRKVLARPPIRLASRHGAILARQSRYPWTHAGRQNSSVEQQ